MKFKFYILFFLFVFLISFCQAKTISLSPNQINFVGKTGKTICQNIDIEVDKARILIGKDRWAEKGIFEHELSLHNLNSEKLELELKYPREILVENKSEIQICLTGKNSGNYHGALLYRIKDKPIQIGIWMNVSLEGNSLLKITGNFIKAEEGRNIGVYFAIILFLILGGLFVWSRMKK